MAQAPAAQARCLIIEDEVLVGMDLEDALCGAGFDVQWVASAPSAFEALATSPFDVAILDLVVRSEPCMSLARELKRRAIPFLVYSGYARKRSPIEMNDVPWLAKPAEVHEMIEALTGILEASGPSGLGENQLVLSG
jgi:DNA-binding response OmpR family regulator